MVVDFQHHYVPVELAKKRGLYSDKTTYLQEGGRRATTMHARLYDLDLQLKDMREGGIDVSVLSCLLGWNASLDECRLINDDLSRVQGKYTVKFCWARPSTDLGWQRGAARNRPGDSKPGS